MAHAVALLAPEGRLTTYRRRSLHSSPTQTKRAQQQAIYNRTKAEEDMAEQTPGLNGYGGGSAGVPPAHPHGSPHGQSVPAS